MGTEIEVELRSALEQCVEALRAISLRYYWGNNPTPDEAQAAIKALNRARAVHPNTGRV